MKKYIYILCFLGSFLSSSFSQDSEVIKSKNINKIISITSDTTFLSEILNLAKASAPNIQEAVWNEYFGTNDMFSMEIKKLVHEFYSQHFSNAELEEILKFYDSKVGKKLLNLKDKLYSYGAEWGETWAEDRIDDFYKRIDSTQQVLKRSGECDRIVIGSFEYTENLTGDTITVERGKEKQVEFLPGGIAEYSIEWIDQCYYKITCQKYIDESYNYMIGVETEVKVFDISTSGYRYLAKVPQYGYADISELRILK